MSTLNPIVVARLEEIQNTFRQGQQLATAIENIPDLQTAFTRFETRFRSVAYEAAAMVFALKDLETGSTLSHWQNLLDAAPQHSTQIHIGLGWALAQQQINPTPQQFAYLSPLYAYKVFDGIGYYDGFFRKRKSIVAQQAPEYNEAAAISAYYQGLGRSIWYSNNGNVDHVKNVVDTFTARVQQELWQGLGTAIGYAGGVAGEGIMAIVTAAGMYKTNLLTGVQAAIQSRNQALSNDGEVDVLEKTLKGLIFNSC